MSDPPNAEPRASRLFSVLRSGPRLLLLVVVALVVIQLVPYRVKDHPVVAEPRWDTARTRELAVTACYDCHSNQTRPVWYEQVAPISWWITNHVDEGRAALNFSECTTGKKREDEPADAVREGSMPPSYYTWLGLHSDARLSPAERQELATGLAATVARGCVSAR